MKKIFYLLFSGLLLIASPAFSQSAVYNEGDLSVNAGLSLGVIGYGFGYYGSAGFPVPLSVNVDYGLTDMISVGPYLGYLRRSYGSVNDRYSFTSIAFGGHAMLHASSLLNEHFDLGIDESKVDVYGKLILGYETYSWRYNGESLNNWYYNNSGRVVFGPVVGARYMFTPNIGGYAEGGRGTFGWLTLGISLKM